MELGTLFKINLHILHKILFIILGNYRLKQGYDIMNRL